MFQFNSSSNKNIKKTKPAPLLVEVSFQLEFSIDPHYVVKSRRDRGPGDRDKLINSWGRDTKQYLQLNLKFLQNLLCMCTDFLMCFTADPRAGFF